MNLVHSEKVKQKRLGHLREELADVNKRIAYLETLKETPNISHKLQALINRQSQLEHGIYRLTNSGLPA